MIAMPLSPEAQAYYDDLVKVYGWSPSDAKRVVKFWLLLTGKG